MFTKKVSTKSSFALMVMAVFVLLLQSVFVLPAPSASALTDQQKRDCYTKFDGKDIIITELSAQDQAAFNSCKSDGTCVDNGEGDIIGSRSIKCILPSNANDSTSVQKASDLESARVVKLYCGTKPSDTTSNTALRYTDCANDVKTAYAKCKYTGGSTRSSVTDTPENIASCMITALKAYKPAGVKPADLQKTVANAIKGGQTDAANLLKTASSKKDCEDKGGTWDPSQDPACVTSAPDTTDECPLPDDTSMRWLGCSIMSAAQVATDKLYGAIQNFLYTPTDMIFGNANLKKGADSIRNLAIGLILIAGLIMVIAQATGSEIIDAYTIRKLLPRIGVAVIGIALAWPLLRFAITFINDLGLLADRILIGVTGLGSSGTGSSNDLGTNILSTFFAAGAAGGAVLFLGAAGLVSLAGTILLALLLGLLVLAIRQLVIMVCVMIAPLAIAAYVLPGTQKLWNFWQNTLTTALLMFPIIMFFLASGKVFASVLGGANTATSSLLAIIVFIAPYFLLPFAFKLAGGLMSTVFSIANDRNRGMFDRLKKSRQNSMQNNWEGMKTGNRFKGKNAVSDWANRKLEYGTNLNKAGVNPYQMKSRMRTALAANAHDEASEYMEKNHAFNAMSGDDAKVYAGKATNRAEIERRLAQFDSGRFGGDAPNNVRARQDAATQILQAQRETSTEVFQMARSRAMPKTGTGYHFKNSKGETMVDYSTMLDDINEAYGSDRNGAGRALAEMRSSLANSGHVAGLAGFGTWAAQLEKNYELRQSGKYNKSVDGKKMHDEIMADTMLSVPAGNALYGKPTSAGALGGAHRQRLQELVTSMNTGAGMIKTGQIDPNTGKDVLRPANQKDVDTALAAAAGVLDAMGSAAPQNAAAFAAEFVGTKISGSGTLSPISEGGAPSDDLTVRDLIDARSTSPEFNALRKEWQYKSQQQGEAYEQQRQLQERLAQAGKLPGGIQPPNFGMPKQ